jgi:hypothetical protein|tara:strand:+ start:405 stop:590 length:186 start_codon:yes stop_codon:yes gene_type:complete
MNELWLFLSYLAGSAVTFWLMRNVIEKVLIERCIDKLIADGFLKSKIDAKGETEILKWNES